MHCGIEQQKMMAEYFKEYLRDIYTFDTTDFPDKYPSPIKLQKKFIIKESKNLDPKLLEKSYFEKIDPDSIFKRSETKIDLKIDSPIRRKMKALSSKGFEALDINKKGEEESEKNLNDQTEIIDNQNLDNLFKYDESLMFVEEFDDIRIFIFFNILIIFYYFVY